MQLLKKLLISSEKALSIPGNDFNVYFYDDETEREIVREQNIKRELALIADNESHGGLYLQYQPILDLSSGRISGFEALARPALQAARRALIPGHRWPGGQNSFSRRAKVAHRVYPIHEKVQP